MVKPTPFGQPAPVAQSGVDTSDCYMAVLLFRASWKPFSDIKSDGSVPFLDKRPNPLSFAQQSSVSAEALGLSFMTAFNPLRSYTAYAHRFFQARLEALQKLVFAYPLAELNARYSWSSSI